MHAWLAPWIPALVLAHLTSAVIFVVLHAPSAHAMWQLRRARDPARVRALLDRSRAASSLSTITVILLSLSGAALASSEHAWRLPWVWISAVLLLAMTLAMSILAARPFNEARHALGIRWFDGTRVQPATGIVQAEALAIAMARVRARAAPTMAIGLLGLAALVWLMLARPG